MILLCGGIGKFTSCVCASLLTIRFSQVFPTYSSAPQIPCKNSALAKIKEKRALKALSTNTVT
jgi:hypothetical protein